MKPRLFAIVLLSAAALFAAKALPSGLTVDCDPGTSLGACAVGFVSFSGTDYPKLVHVFVENSAGDVWEDANYVTSGGVLEFTQTLAPADTYHIVVEKAHGKAEPYDDFEVTTD